MAESPLATSAITLTITGTSGGPATEVLTLPVPGGAVRGQTGFTAISQVAATGSAGAPVTVRTIRASGADATVWTELDAALAGRLWKATRPVLVDGAQGRLLAARHYFATNALTLRPGDRLTVDATDYLVEAAEVVYNGHGPHHTEATLWQQTH